MSTSLILLTLALAILDTTLSLATSSIKPLNESVPPPPDEEADDLPFGPAPSDQY